MASCVIALGANLGNPAATLRAVADRLASDPRLRNVAISSLYETSPAGGPPGQPAYVNAAARFETDLPPGELLQLLQQWEEEFGRQRLQTWGARTLDLDLLLYDQQVIHSDVLTVPHPRLSFRRFVLEPAVEIAGDAFHPSLRATLSQLLQHVNSAPRYVAVASACWFAKQYVVSSAIEALKGGGVAVRPLAVRGMTVLGAPPVDDIEHPFVEHYVELLPRLAADLRDALAHPRDWTIGNYWPGEIELGARLWFTGAARELCERTYQEHFRDVPRPQLLVYLETPDDLLLFNPQAIDESSEFYEHARRQAAQRDALDGFVAEQSGLPLFRLSAEKPEAALCELYAAVIALAGK